MGQINIYLTLNNGTLTVTDNVDFDGDLDVDGTTNLDVVDIDGAVDMASTLTLAGNADFNGDIDGDVIVISVEDDVDGDGILDEFDDDIDGDGVLNKTETIDNTSSYNACSFLPTNRPLLTSTTTIASVFSMIR